MDTYIKNQRLVNWSAKWAVLLTDTTLLLLLNLPWWKVSFKQSHTFQLWRDPPLHHGCRSDGFFFVNPQQDDDVSKKGIGKKDSFRRWSEVKYLQSSSVLTNRLDAADNALRTNDNLPKHVTGFNAVFHCQQGTVLDDSTGEEEEEDGGEAQHEEVDRSGFVCFCYT